MVFVASWLIAFFEIEDMDPASPVFILAKRRVRRKRRAVPTPPDAGPVLVAAAYDAGDQVLTIAFDRAVDVGNIVVEEFIVLDGNLGVEWAGTGDELTQPTPASVAMFMTDGGAYAGTGVTLNVSAANGIVAVDGGAAWAGAAGVELPFP